MPKGTGRPNKKGETDKQAKDRAFRRMVLREEDRKVAEGERAFQSGKPKEQLRLYNEEAKKKKKEIEKSVQNRLKKMYPSMNGK